MVAQRFSIAPSFARFLQASLLLTLLKRYSSAFKVSRICVRPRWDVIVSRLGVSRHQIRRYSWSTSYNKFRRWKCAEAAVGICKSKSVGRIDIAISSRVIYGKRVWFPCLRERFNVSSPFQMPWKKRRSLLLRPDKTIPVWFVSFVAVGSWYKYRISM